MSCHSPKPDRPLQTSYSNSNSTRPISQMSNNNGRPMSTDPDAQSPDF